MGECECFKDRKGNRRGEVVPPFWRGRREPLLKVCFHPLEYEKISSVLLIHARIKKLDYSWVIKFLERLRFSLEYFGEDRLLNLVVPKDLDSNLAAVVEHVVRPVNQGHSPSPRVRGKRIAAIHEPGAIFRLA